MATTEAKPKRLYRRVRPASGGAAKAQIVVGPKQPAIACRLVDYSRGGACPSRSFRWWGCRSGSNCSMAAWRRKAGWCGGAASGSAWLF